MALTAITEGRLSFLDIPVPTENIMCILAVEGLVSLGARTPHCSFMSERQMIPQDERALEGVFAGIDRSHRNIAQC
jgi:hypothetical protein